MAALGLAAAWSQTDQKTSREVQNRVRGQTPVQDPHAVGPVIVKGILVDAGCPDRSSLNLRTPPEPISGNVPTQQNGVSAKGITVSGGTLANERSDALQHQVPDMLTRQMDPTCAITGATKGFAILTDAGRLYDLDEGGNTYAWEAVLSSAAGRAMLNGSGQGVKPRVVITGRQRGDRITAEKVAEAQ